MHADRPTTDRYLDREGCYGGRDCNMSSLASICAGSERLEHLVPTRSDGAAVGGRRPAWKPTCRQCRTMKFVRNACLASSRRYYNAP